MGKLTATTIKAANEPGRFGNRASSFLFADKPYGSLISGAKGLLHVPSLTKSGHAR